MRVISLAELLAEPEPKPRRLPVLNTEPRVQMGGRKWHLIHERDGGRCYICGGFVPKGSGEVDHVIPRSSFEAHDLERADRSDNLRTACVRCNQKKSNYAYDWATGPIGVTSVCWSCLNPDEPQPVMRAPAYCGRCGHTWVPDERWLL